ncbi:MAG: NADPH:quinone reductase [Acidobacteria bacterium]|nr:NADPH:quinone reductase [Acidobacteriota bacterium]
MKAIVVREFGGPEVMKAEEVETPAPNASQVLVKIESAGVNPVDTYIRSGIHAIRPDLPFTPGKDGAGTVAAVGEAVAKFAPGDRVFLTGTLTGTYAEYVLCNEDQLEILPDNVSFEAGASVWIPYATAYRALFQRGRAANGEIVLIHGASGAVGIAAIQWAKNAGLTVIGTASSAEGKQLASENGADAVFDHTDEGHFAAIKEFTGGKGVDLVIEMLANENLERDFEALAMYGRIIVVGNRGSLQFTPRLAMTKDADILGMTLFNAPPDKMAEIKTAIYDGLKQGFLKPVVGKTFPLAEAAAAHHAVINDKAFGKIVLIPG